jgi:hypothetical protein
LQHPSSGSLSFLDSNENIPNNPHPKRFISTSIDFNTVHFKKDQFNIIASGCGTGKSHMIIHDLLKIKQCREMKIQPSQVMFITSRAITVEQQSRNEGITKFNPNDISTLAYWNGMADSEELLIQNDIRIMTYDKIIEILRSGNTEEAETLNNVKIIILDECHTMFSDTFIKDIEVLKVWIRDTLYRNSKIFLGLTATPKIIENNKTWGVQINRINKDPLMRYTAKQLICTNFNTIPYLIVTDRLPGKTIIMCYSVKDCYALQSKLHNAAVLVSQQNKYHFTKQMEKLRQYIIDNETLPDEFDYLLDDGTVEKRKLDILITTSTLREGFNLRANSGVKNVICCFSDELHITQFMGRCRFDIDNLVVAETYIRDENFNQNTYLADCRNDFKSFIRNMTNVKWFNAIAHLVDHDCYGVKRFLLGTDEQRFIDYINSRWLAPSGLEGHALDRYKIYKDEDKKEIIDLAIECKLFSLYKNQITFIRVIKMLEQCLGYAVESGKYSVDCQRYTYKLVVSFDEDKINYTPPYETIT